MIECENVVPSLLEKKDTNKIDVLGISECRWIGQGKVKLNTG